MSYSRPIHLAVDFRQVFTFFILVTAFRIFQEHVTVYIDRRVCAHTYLRCIFECTPTHTHALLYVRIFLHLRCRLGIRVVRMYFQNEYVVRRTNRDLNNRLRNKHADKRTTHTFIHAIDGGNHGGKVERITRRIYATRSDNTLTFLICFQYR